MKIALAGLLLLAGLLSCATAPLMPVDQFPTGLQLEDDERRLWNRAQKEQARLDNSGHLYQNAALESYVNEVAQRLKPVGLQGKGLVFRVRIIKNPLLNAFTFANGTIYVHTGILARMDNEAQLATLLGHEMNHAIHRHMVQQFRTVQNASALYATFQVVMLPLGAYGNLGQMLGSMGTLAAVSGYSRELEAEADADGLELMVTAGYDPMEAPALFAHLQREVDEAQINEPFFFGSHPRLQERVENYNRLINSRFAGRRGDKGEDKFRQMIFPLLLDNARLDLAMGRFGSAAKSITRTLQQEPRNAKARYILGELYRQRGEEGDGDRAQQEYRLAVSYDPAYADPYKGLGLIDYKQGRKEEARRQFAKYLLHAPAAKDKPYIEQYLDAIKAGQ
jgi:predicted Zn-dependent protease